MIGELNLAIAVMVRAKTLYDVVHENFSRKVVSSSCHHVVVLGLDILQILLALRVRCVITNWRTNDYTPFISQPQERDVPV